jgi:hypothetical protein
MPANWKRLNLALIAMLCAAAIVAIVGGPYWVSAGGALWMAVLRGLDVRGPKPTPFKLEVAKEERRGRDGDLSRFTLVAGVVGVVWVGAMAVLLLTVGASPGLTEGVIWAGVPLAVVASIVLVARSRGR